MNLTTNTIRILCTATLKNKIFLRGATSASPHEIDVGWAESLCIFNGELLHRSVMERIPLTLEYVSETVLKLGTYRCRGADHRDHRTTYVPKLLSVLPRMYDVCRYIYHRVRTVYTTPNMMV